jgi:hypothetical protein
MEKELLLAQSLMLPEHLSYLLAYIRLCYLEKVAMVTLVRQEIPALLETPVMLVLTVLVAQVVLLVQREMLERQVVQETPVLTVLVVQVALLA